MIRSPRERFQENKAEALAHAELCVKPSFLRAVDAALLQYTQTLPAVKDAHASMTNSARLEGATELVRVLLTLADPATPVPPRISSNLPGNVR